MITPIIARIICTEAIKSMMSNKNVKYGVLIGSGVFLSFMLFTMMFINNGGVRELMKLYETSSEDETAKKLEWVYSVSVPLVASTINKQFEKKADDPNSIRATDKLLVITLCSKLFQLGTEGSPIPNESVLDVIKAKKLCQKLDTLDY